MKSKHKDERGTVLGKYNSCISCRLRVGEHKKSAVIGIFIIYALVHLNSKGRGDIAMPG